MTISNRIAAVILLGASPLSASCAQPATSATPNSRVEAVGDGAGPSTPASPNVGASNTELHRRTVGAVGDGSGPGPVAIPDRKAVSNPEHNSSSTEVVGDGAGPGPSAIKIK